MQNTCEKNAFCSALSSQQRESLCGLAKKITFDKGEYVFLEKGRNSSVILISSGEVFALRGNSDGKVKCVDYLMAGDIYGLTLLFDGPARSSTEEFAYVKVPVTACSITCSTLEQMIMDNGQVSKKIISCLLNRFWSLADHVEDLCLEKSEERLLHIIQWLRKRRSDYGADDGITRFTHEEMSFFTGHNRVTVTRLINKLARSERIGP